MLLYGLSAEKNGDIAAADLAPASKDDTLTQPNLLFEVFQYESIRPYYV